MQLCKWTACSIAMHNNLDEPHKHTTEAEKQNIKGHSAWFHVYSAWNRQNEMIEFRAAFLCGNKEKRKCRDVVYIKGRMMEREDCN